MRTHVSVLVVALVLALSPAVLAFETIPAGHWAATAVEDLHNEGVLVGYPDGTFRGAQAATRYELAIALKRLENVVRGLAANTRVAGVSEGDRNADAVSAVANEAANIKTMVDALAEAVRQDDRRDAAQEQAIKDLSAAVAALEQAVKGNSARIDDLQKLVDQLSSRLAAVDQAAIKAMIQAEIAPLKTQLDKLSEENSQLKAEVNEQKSKLKWAYWLAGGALLFAAIN